MKGTGLLSALLPVRSSFGTTFYQCLQTLTLTLTWTSDCAGELRRTCLSKPQCAPRLYLRITDSACVPRLVRKVEFTPADSRHCTKSARGPGPKPGQPLPGTAYALTQRVQGERRESIDLLAYALTQRVEGAPVVRARKFRLRAPGTSWGDAYATSWGYIITHVGIYEGCCVHPCRLWHRRTRKTYYYTGIYESHTLDVARCLFMLASVYDQSRSASASSSREGP
eukprot:1183527-Prorocentrum_minimum.AAC.1